MSQEEFAVTELASIFREAVDTLEGGIGWIKDGIFNFAEQYEDGETNLTLPVGYQELSDRMTEMIAELKKEWPDDVKEDLGKEDALRDIFEAQADAAAW